MKRLSFIIPNTPRKRQQRRGDFLVVLSLLILAWTVRSLVALIMNGCDLGPRDERLEPPEPRCAGLTLESCLARVSKGDAGRD